MASLSSLPSSPAHSLSLAPDNSNRAPHPPTPQVEYYPTMWVDVSKMTSDEMGMVAMTAIEKGR
jgi:hypothetical protein